MDVSLRRLTTGDEVVACEVARSFKSAAISSGQATAYLANSANYLVVAEVPAGSPDSCWPIGWTVWTAGRSSCSSTKWRPVPPTGVRGWAHS